MDIDDYKYSRIITFIIPGAKKVYCIKILTNDSSVDLHSQEIKDLMESVDDCQFLLNN